MNVIIWGLKPYTHTHSWIHWGFAKAFEYLGFNVLWIDKNDTVDPSVFKDALVISEANNDEGILIDGSATYIVHRYKKDTYIGAKKVVNLEFYSKPVEDSEIKIYPPHYQNMACVLKRYQEIAQTVWFGNEILESNNMHAPTLFMSWGTDLLPNDIELIDPGLIRASRRPDVTFVGSVWGVNMNEMQDLVTKLAERKINFNVLGLHNGAPINNEMAKHITRLSLFSPAIVGKDHIDMGYVPCRIYKNLSYSRMPATNLPHASEILPGIVMETDLDRLIDQAIEFENNPDVNLMNGLVNHVRINHTFLNRAKNILEVI